MNKTKVTERSEHLSPTETSGLRPLDSVGQVKVESKCGRAKGNRSQKWGWPRASPSHEIARQQRFDLKIRKYAPLK